MIKAGYILLGLGVAVWGSWVFIVLKFIGFRIGEITGLTVGWMNIDIHSRGHGYQESLISLPTHMLWVGTILVLLAMILIRSSR